MSKKKNKKATNKPAKVVDKLIIEKGFCKCHVCGEVFKLHAKDRMTVKSPHQPFSLAAGAEYDAWDCLFCGAQNRLNERYAEVEKEENQ